MTRSARSKAKTRASAVQPDMLAAGSTPKRVAELGRKAKSSQRKLLEAGRKAHLKEDWHTALRYYDEAWQNDLDNLDLLTLVAYSLTQLDAREQAMSVVERALKIHGANETLCQILGVLASKMFFYEIAEKLWREAIKLNPQNSFNYVNLLGAMYEQQKFDEVVEAAQEVLPVFADSSDLWSILATCIKYTENSEMAPQFFEEALRLDPNNIKALNNYSMLLGTSDRGFEIAKRALAIDKNNSEINVGIASCYFLRGDLVNGWKHYEHRLDSTRAKGQNVIYDVSLPDWNEKPDPSASVLVLNEQGIGDEVLFLRVLEKLIDDVGEVYVGCDVRLAAIIERSFPSVKAVFSASQERLGFTRRVYPELAQLMEQSKNTKWSKIAAGSLWRVYCPTVEDIPICQNGYLLPDPERVEQFRDRLHGDNDGRFRVGVSWRSGNVSVHRANSDMGLSPIIKCLEGFDIELVILQYSNAKSGVDELRETFGEDRVTYFDDIDLKADIEANYAIMSNLDLVIGPGIATQMIALSVGVPVGMMNYGRPWWNFQIPSQDPYRRCKCQYIPNLRWIDVGPHPVESSEIPDFRIALEQMIHDKKAGRSG